MKLFSCKKENVNISVDDDCSVVIINWCSASYSRPARNTFSRIKHVYLKFLLGIRDMHIAANHHNQNLLTYIFFKPLRVL